MAKQRYLASRLEPEGFEQQRGRDQGQHGDRARRRRCLDVRGHVSALDLSTNSPCGRTWRNATIAANTITLARLASVQNSA